MNQDPFFVKDWKKREKTLFSDWEKKSITNLIEKFQINFSDSLWSARNQKMDFLESDKLLEYIEKQLKINKIKNRPHQSFLTGGALMSWVLSFIDEKEYKFNDIDIFVNAKANENDYDFSGKLAELNPKENNYGHITNNLYTKLNIQSHYVHETYSYGILGSIYEEKFNYTFLQLGQDFSYYTFLESFDLNCVQVVYDLELKKLYFTKYFVNFIKTRKIEFTDFVDTDWLETNNSNFFQTYVRASYKAKLYPFLSFDKFEYLKNMYIGILFECPLMKEGFLNKRYFDSIPRSKMISTKEDNDSSELTNSFLMSDKIFKILEENQGFFHPFFTLKEDALYMNSLDEVLNSTEIDELLFLKDLIIEAKKQPENFLKYINYKATYDKNFINSNWLYVLYSIDFQKHNHTKNKINLIADNMKDRPDNFANSFIDHISNDFKGGLINNLFDDDIECSLKNKYFNLREKYIINSQEKTKYAFDFLFDLLLIKLSFKDSLEFIDKHLKSKIQFKDILYMMNKRYLSLGEERTDYSDFIDSYPNGINSWIKEFLDKNYFNLKFNKNFNELLELDILVLNIIKGHQGNRNKFNFLFHTAVG